MINTRQSSYTITHTHAYTLTHILFVVLSIIIVLYCFCTIHYHSIILFVVLSIIIVSYCLLYYTLLLYHVVCCTIHYQSKAPTHSQSACLFICEHNHNCKFLSIHWNISFSLQASGCYPFCLSLLSVWLAQLVKALAALTHVRSCVREAQVRFPERTSSTLASIPPG